jgi:hypothetical protein
MPIPIKSESNLLQGRLKKARKEVHVSLGPDKNPYSKEIPNPSSMKFWPISRLSPLARPAFMEWPNRLNANNEMKGQEEPKGLLLRICSLLRTPVVFKIILTVRDY